MRRARTAQLQALEPVIIVIMLALIGIIGGVFFLRSAHVQSGNDAQLLDEQESLAVLKRLSAAPELSCPQDIGTQSYCIDTYKAFALRTTTNESTNATAYRSLFGNALVTIEILDIETGSTTEILLYNGTRGSGDIRAQRSYATAYNASSNTLSFATLVVRRES